MTRLTLRLVTAAALFAAGSAQATLFDRGGGLIYDSAQNITWLQDWNLGKGSGLDVIRLPDSTVIDALSGLGKMNWGSAKSWAEQLDFRGYTDWRLPAHTEVGATKTPCDRSSWIGGTGSCGLFNNVQSGEYWNGDVNPGEATMDDPFAQINAGLIFHFAPGPGSPRGDFTSTDALFAVAVRNGDVAAVSTVPEPETWALMLLGLGALGMKTRQRKIR